MLTIQLLLPFILKMSMKIQSWMISLCMSMRILQPIGQLMVKLLLAILMLKLKTHLHFLLFLHLGMKICFTSVNVMVLWVSKEVAMVFSIMRRKMNTYWLYVSWMMAAWNMFNWMQDVAWMKPLTRKVCVTRLRLRWEFAIVMKRPPFLKLLLNVSLMKINHWMRLLVFPL